MKQISKADAQTLASIQNRLDKMASRLMKQAKHAREYVDACKAEEEIISVLGQLGAASAALEMILERLDN